MSSVVLTGSTSGSVTVQAAAVAGSNTATIGAATGTHFPFTAGTAVASTSGTSIDFTSIPSWVKRITVMFSGVSTNGTSTIQVQLGSGSVTTTGYLSTAAVISGTNTTTTATYTSGFGLRAPLNANDILHGNITINHLGDNKWVESSVLGFTTNNYASFGGGSISLGGTIDRIRITTVNGTDTFDAGSINIFYE